MKDAMIRDKQGRMSHCEIAREWAKMMRTPWEEYCKTMNRIPPKKFTPDS